MKKHFYYFFAVALLLTTAIVGCKEIIEEIKVTGVTLDKTILELLIDETTTLTATVHPANADNKNVSWESSNINIATVTKNDAVTATVTTKAEGVVIISVFTEDGRQKATCTIAVGSPPPPPPHPAEPELIWVEGGTFIMGCLDGTDEDCLPNERPEHEVTLTGFHIAKYPVTQRQWKLIMGNNPSRFQGDDLPVERVSWHDAQEFITRLNDASGKNYRLPTEAEWEYAARGGYRNQGLKYSGSNEVNEVAWFVDNSENKTHIVGKKEPNELLIFDMSGNVLEWCNDWFHQNYYSNSPQIDPQGPSETINRVQRGGGYLSPATQCRVSRRHHATPTSISNDPGFRLAHP